MDIQSIRTRSGDLRQFASIRRITLDDGPERGLRALAFSTGGGLDFWVLADRSLDIGPLWWRGRQLGWQGPMGFRHPAYHAAESDAGFGFDRSFSGFLVTCGLDRIRQPADGQPLHGRLPFTPARVSAYGEDWERDEPVLFCEGEVVQARFGAEALRLRRRIEAPIGGAGLSITDVVENIGARPSPQASLYHFNLGHPAIADGTIVEAAGRTLLGPLRVPDAEASTASFSRPADAAPETTCTVITRAAAGQHSGAGSGTDLAVDFAWATASLPHLQLWHDLTPRTCVLGIEPCTSARLDGGKSGPEAIIAPSEKRDYALRVSMRDLPAATDSPAE